MPTKKFGFVTLAGRPNVGKSTLLNRMIGEKVAITTPRPQTTRNRIAGIMTREEMQVVFLDTPGIMKGERSGLNRYMTNVSVQAGSDTDILAFITDATKPDFESDKFAMSKFRDSKSAKLLLVNKIDAVKKAKLLPLIDQLASELGPFDSIIPLSAKSGENIDIFLDEIKSRLEEGPHHYPDDMVTDQPEKFFIAEVIREKAFLRLSQELPYSTAVVVEQTEDRPNNVFAIDAVIYVERESQKGIVIGKKGAMLKEIGSSARRDLERKFGVKVYLELRVKQRNKWTADPRSLRDLGYIADE